MSRIVHQSFKQRRGRERRSHAKFTVRLSRTPSPERSSAISSSSSIPPVEAFLDNYHDDYQDECHCCGIADWKAFPCPNVPRCQTCSRVLDMVKYRVLG